ncbi:DUF4230 domain-containing protein [Microvirga sp. SRT01]|uniref:DUF4230 domain-containing protein n=1 Tax=Sphingomonas longa TaxID=2778730 RepID=A0ABS2D5K7_9SPHN|nr:DUF4230 domain-containing protein [Microvirga sp. SRT01]MBM6576203.1 DUF4230 domain-containing protein [Sphingomonas sp. BT552]MBR7709249.1 DUF4230 domain-containing protein [Microvirga sp. SRT01]
MADRGMTPDVPTPNPQPPVRSGGGIGAFLVKATGVVLILVLAALLVLWGVQRYVTERLTPDPVTVASASLEGLREQNRLSAFAARFVAVTTSTQSQYGLSTKKTLIMPGMVRYEVDLGKLTPRDVAWDAKTSTLSVRLPPVEVEGPQIDLTQIREYGSGGLLTTFTDAESRLDEANRRAGQIELVRQAKAAPMIRIARDATRRAVERSFAMPLNAAGVPAKVQVRFADEPVANDERWDVSRSLEDVLGNRR